MTQQKTYHSSGRRMDYSDLDGRFTRYYERGERVEVKWKPGHEDFTGYGLQTNGRYARFWVGRSTGWRPTYLMILRRDSTGGAGISSASVEWVRGLGIFRRQRRR